MYGGHPPSEHGVIRPPITDLWNWDGEHWTQLLPARAPTPRLAAGMAFDEVHAQLVLFGGVSETRLQDTWLLHLDDPTHAEEQCHTGFDGNGDGKIGCDDADCTAVCTQCGDGACDAVETCRSCPDDCGACSVCGDFHCDPGETCASCPGDCCSIGAP
jgi:hypothetical protein